MAQAAKKYEYDLGYTHIVQAKNGRMKRLIACSPDVLGEYDFKDKKDIYYTPNTFNSPLKREREDLWQLHRFYIDIDHREGTQPIDKFEVAIAIQNLVENNIIPAPSEYINSGRGIHVYWNIYNCHVMLLDLWEKIENHIYNSIKTIEKEINNIKVDKLATDPTRLLRLEGTINSKNNELCYSMLKNDNAYDIFDLKRLYIKPTVKKKRQGSNISTLPTKNLYTLNMYRIEDFKKIVQLRHGNVKGYRNALIMFYSYHYRLANDITVDELIKVTRQFNKSFKEPYPSKELIAVCRSINKTVKHFKEDSSKGYKFTNKYIIDRVDIKPEEEKQLKTIISTYEKYRRNNERRIKERRNEKGLTQREQQKENTIKAIQELKAKGLSQSKVSKESGYSIALVKRYWNI